MNSVYIALIPVTLAIKKSTKRYHRLQLKINSQKMTKSSTGKRKMIESNIGRGKMIETSIVRRRTIVRDLRVRNIRTTESPTQ